MNTIIPIQIGFSHSIGSFLCLTNLTKPVSIEKIIKAKVDARGQKITEALDETMALPQPTSYVYMLLCADGTLYTGWTYHLQARVRQHNTGKGAKYTKSRRPVQLVYTELLQGKPAALRRECAIKRLTRLQKLELVRLQAALEQYDP